MTHRNIQKSSLTTSAKPVGVGLRVNGGRAGANNLDCGRAWLREAFHRVGRGTVDCVSGIATGDTRVRGEFDLVMAAQKRACR